MNIVFVSNYINHHQIPVAKQLSNLCKKDGGSYTFIETEPMEEERLAMGWGDSVTTLDFVQKYDDNPTRNQKIIEDADCVIFGGTDEEKYIVERLKNNKIIWRYSERLYREGRYKWISPGGLKKKFLDHTRQLKNTYLLCAGAYVAGDFRLILSYIGKKYRYGYFPEFKPYEIATLLRKKTENKKEESTFLWAARMIELKHPKLPVLLAKKLKENGYQFHITMLGDGPLFPEVKEMIKKLDVEDKVTLVGFQSPEETRRLMEESDFFLATSDFREGWGAVINEAMNSGCVVIANKKIGAVPSLLKHNKNGIVYQRLLNPKTLKIICQLMNHKIKRERIAEAAYETIEMEWNHVEAAKRLYEVIKATCEKKEIPYYKSGPLSKHYF